MLSDDNFLSELLSVLDGTIPIRSVEPEGEVDDSERFLGVLGDETGKRLWQLVQEYKHRQFTATQKRFPEVKKYADFLPFQPSVRATAKLGFKEYGKLLLEMQSLQRKQFLAHQLFLGRVGELFPEILKNRVPEVEVEMRRGWKVVGWNSPH